MTLVKIIVITVLIIISILANHALDFGIVYLLRKSASFLSALEPVLGIVDRIRGHAGRPSGFTSVHTAALTGCALIGLLASRAACAYRNL